MADLSSAATRSGYCATTVSGYAGDCTYGLLGSFPLPPSAWLTPGSLRDACVAACLRCSRCSAVSFSLDQRDCSWFHVCEMERLHQEVPGFTTLPVRSLPLVHRRGAELAPFSAVRMLLPAKTDFPSQEAQDLCVIEHVFKRMTRGYYLDIGANAPVFLSNTYALDRQYNWSGLCIEPQESYAQGYLQSRTCTLAQVLLGDGDEVVFVNGRDGWDNLGESHVATHAVPQNRTEMPSRTMKTSLLRKVLQIANVPRTIDYVSLDLEGYEFKVMKRFPWNKHSIGVLTIERPGADLHALLLNKGFCVAHNAASFVDIMYLNRSLSSVSTARCKRVSSMPQYIRPADLCSAR
ncbi:hypothetical protein AB1Y20_012658 [Prymnesium parvum]|uniref:Methyltransferase FkbM domain-containing protein n=1 Tax=Prymnesium parvum TaxID=97485 RepID=A0AB34IJ11_PRYPA